MLELWVDQYHIYRDCEGGTSPAGGGGDEEGLGEREEGVFIFTLSQLVKDLNFIYKSHLKKEKKYS